MKSILFRDFDYFSRKGYDAYLGFNTFNLHAILLDLLVYSRINHYPQTLPKYFLDPSELSPVLVDLESPNATWLVVLCGYE